MVGLVSANDDVEQFRTERARGSLNHCIGRNTSLAYDVAQDDCITDSAGLLTPHEYTHAGSQLQQGSGENTPISQLTTLSRTNAS